MLITSDSVCVALIKEKRLGGPRRVRATSKGAAREVSKSGDGLKCLEMVLTRADCKELQKTFQGE